MSPGSRSAVWLNRSADSDSWVVLASSFSICGISAVWMTSNSVSQRIRVGMCRARNKPRSANRRVLASSRVAGSSPANGSMVSRLKTLLVIPGLGTAVHLCNFGREAQRADITWVNAHSGVVRARYWMAARNSLICSGLSVVAAIRQISFSASCEASSKGLADSP